MSKLQLKKEDFKRIKAKYPYNCAGCNKRYPKDTVVYWKREVDNVGVGSTTTICQQCFKKR